MQAVLFDNDGVLVETEHLYYEASRDTLAEAGVDLTVAIYRDVSLHRGASVMELARAAGADDEEIRRLWKLRDDRYAARLEQGVTVLEGVTETLDALAADGLRLAIVTTCPGPHFHIQHRTTGLLPRFEAILVREDYPKAKPHPDPYLAGARALGLAPEHCVAVEDSPRGVASARAAGMPCFAIPSGLTRGQDFSAATAVLETCRELPAAIRLQRA